MIYYYIATAKTGQVSNTLSNQISFIEAAKSAMIKGLFDRVTMSTPEHPWMPIA